MRIKLYFQALNVPACYLDDNMSFYEPNRPVKSATRMQEETMQKYCKASLL